jgi:hypothetical protein
VLAYDVPEQNPDTNKFQTRRINKPGPTGLITTSTRSLQQQLGTRVLELHVPDDAAQTERIIAAQAHSVDGSQRQPFDPAVLIAFQRYLAATGPYRVVVPFSRALGTLVPFVAVRMRRDFPQLLTCYPLDRRAASAPAGFARQTAPSFASLEDLCPRPVTC